MEITLDSIRDIRIFQSRNGYRFSVDALLLYSFVTMPVAKRIADLGAGSGIVGILLAKKYPRSEALLIELQGSLARLARKNIGENGLEGRVSVFECDIRDLRERGGSVLSSGQFDIVVSNPPFRKTMTGLMSPEEEKAIARHEVRLKLPELASAARHLLRSRGRLFLVHHPARLGELLETLKEEAMEVKRLRFVHSGPSSEAKMVLVEAVKDGRPGLKVEPPLFTHGEDGDYSDEVRGICRGDGGCADVLC